jgi:uncharacterized repeat protein (TIGR01451 family)
MVLASRKSGGKVSALVLALLLLFVTPRSATPLTPARTVISHSFTARYLNASRPAELPSNQTRITVKDLADPLLVPPRKTVTVPGQPADFLHTVTNRGNSQDSFKLNASIVQGAGAVKTAGAKIQFFAADGKTLLPTDAEGNQVLGPLAPGGSADLVLRVIPPAGSEGWAEDIVTTATSVQVPLRSANLTDQLIVPAPGLANPVKSVSPDGAVLPGALLSYSIAVANPSLLPVTGVTVSDALNPLLEYQEGSAVIPAELSGNATYDGATRTVSFSLPTVPAGFSGAVSFRARVRADAPGNSSIVNISRIASAGSSAHLSSNSTVTPVLASALRISKTAGNAVAELGDLVPYTVRVENAGTTTLNNVSVFDKLPRGFRYLKGSSILDGVKIADPVGAGNQVSWDLGSFPGGAVRILSYRCAVTGDALPGVSVNSAVASAIGATGGTVLSPTVSAGVKIRPSILGDKAIILGRIFEDRNGNGVPDGGEAGVPGVRVYLENGSYVFTDGDGQYSFTGVSSGIHVVKIDRATLPPQYEAIPYNTAFAGVGWSQFITVPFGGPARGDFALALKENAITPPASAASAASVPEPAAAGGQGVPQPELPLGSGGATRLRVTPERLDMPADGKTVVPFTVELLTADGKRAAGSSLVTVVLSKGVILDPDQDAALPGHQIRVKDGIGVFRVRSGASSGKEEIVVTGENGSRGKVDLFFSGQLRDWILVGVGNLTVGHREVSGHIEKIDNEERFDEGIFHDERLAFFTRGKILGKYLLTAAYDSGKERRDGVFQVIDPEKYYPVYGDASDIGYEAQSRGKIYVKIEAGRSYLLAGDYRTDLSENEFSRYDRALNGVKVEYEGEHLSAKGFESLTEENIIKDEIRGNGTSGYYFLSKKPVFENSERVRIEVRDRYHSERIISVSEKLRYADYSIDYNAGTILFKEPVPSLDQNLNPVTIVINYQSVSGGREQYVYGGRVLLKSATGSYLGGTAVVEQGSLHDNTLYGLDAGVKLGERLSLKGEGAVSDTIERGRGSAYKVELTANPVDSLNVGGYYRKVRRDFYNPSMTGNQEYGTEKYGGRLDYRGLSDTLIFGESFVQKDEILDSKQFGNQAGVLRKFSLLNGRPFEGEAGFKRIEEERPGEDDHSDIIYAGVRGAVTPKLDLTLRRDQLLSPSSVSEYQSRTFLKLDYRLTDKTRAFVTEEYQEGSPSLRQATRFGMETALNERMRLTTGYQLSSGVLGTSEQSSVDLNTRLVDRDGLTIDTRSGYQIENSLSQERGQAILGLNSRLRVIDGLFLNSTLERVETVEGRGGTRTAFTLAGEYLRQKDLKLTGRYEIRDGSGETASLYGAGLAYKLSRSLTLLGKATYWDNDLAAGHDRLLDGYLGTAFRPLADNPLQLLTLARYKMEEKGSLPGYGENRSLILSAEPTFRLVKDFSLQGKYAGKLFWSEFSGASFQSYTDLILAGISYDLAQRWDISLYARLMNQYDSGQHDLGTVASLGYRVYRNVIVSAGYNYARLDDRDLTGETYQGQGPFLNVKVKFDEDMFDPAQSTPQPLAAPKPPLTLAPAPEPPPASEMSEMVSKPPPASEMPEIVPEPVRVAAPVPPPKPPVIPALLVASVKLDEPLKLSGSAELLTLLINGEPARLPSTAVTVKRARLDASVELKRGKLTAPVEFVARVERPDLVQSWTLEILNGEGKAIRSMKGSGAPQRRLVWRGETDGEKLKPGDIYQYQLRVTYRDGSTFDTARDLFGVNRKNAVLLTLSGGAFIFDSARLTEEAKRLLQGAARVLRAHPEEQVILEGHTDAIGTVAYNLDLSHRRCDAAADYLVQKEGIPESRLLRRWYGKSRPIADNGTAQGRSMNRRVELKGNFQESVAVAPNDRYRGKAYVTINDRNVPLDSLGRFETTVPAETEQLKVEMGDSLGRSVATVIPVPSFTLAEPSGSRLVQYGSAAGGIAVASDGSARCTVSGAVQPGSKLEVDGKEVAADGSGNFAADLALENGEHVYGMVLRNAAGCSKLMNLRVTLKPQQPAPGRSEP